MVAVPFGINAYRRDAGIFSETRLINQYLELTQEKTVRLIGRPGLVEAETLGPSPILGMFAQPGTFNGDVFGVSGGALYRAGSSVGSLIAPGLVDMAGSELELLIATGAALYLYDGSAVSLVSFPDSAGGCSAVYAAGLFIVARTGTQKFYWSAVLDGGTWDSLDFASAERKPDNLVGLLMVGDELWMFGENSVEFHSFTGNSEAPIERIQGRVYDKGALNKDCIRAFDNSAVWVGQNKTVYRGGAKPDRISDSGVEEALAVTDAADVSAFVMLWAGHEWYILKTARGSFIYDASTGEWSNYRTYSRDNWRAWAACTVGDVTYLGDDTTGTIWQANDDQLTEDGDAIERISAAILRHSGRPVSIDNLLIDISPGQTPSLTGQGADPEVEMRYSRDGGKTFTGWTAAKIGEAGEYRKRTTWRRLGMMDEPGRLFEFRTTDPAPWTLSGVRVNENSGGRSR